MSQMTEWSRVKVRIDKRLEKKRNKQRRETLIFLSGLFILISFLLGYLLGGSGTKKPSSDSNKNSKVQGSGYRFPSPERFSSGVSNRLPSLDFSVSETIRSKKNILLYSST